MADYALNLERYAQLARRAGAEGCVLLENRDAALPLRAGDRVAVFGRSAFNYYKSGLGSGGLVNTRYVVSILDALKAEKDITLDQELLSVYEAWLKENPYDEGEGWGKVPWSQKEMPLTDQMEELAKKADVSLVIIGRTAGEDQDNSAAPGSYLLTEAEEELIRRVSAACPRTVVVLNVGNIIDMKWVKQYNPAAVLYVWQGGQEGGNAAADVLTGRVTPCGKLADTIAFDIADYPSTENFGDPARNIYAEDIYVGYRYFETFAKEKVLYPFGYGLSYTTFSIGAWDVRAAHDTVRVTASVTNTGDVPGREVVQVYVKAPCGRLGQPARKLIGYKKTKVLAPGEAVSLTVSVPKSVFASYDDGGVTGHKSAWVLEEGTYEVYVGSDVRSAARAGSFYQPFEVTEQLCEALAPITPFERLKAEERDGVYVPARERAPLRTVDMQERLKEKRGADPAYTGDQGWKLADVLDGKVSLDAFTAQLTDEDLTHMFYGEGMCSSKVTPGTAAAFGGLTERLQGFGIPAGCCSDGPSGIRMDCGTKAFSMPNGTLLGCTFDDELTEALYVYEGKELRQNKIDSLLGPGMNLHRNPLNGRNFEYISEDPLLTGRSAAAQLRGMAASGIGSTVKHFACNNQEFHRHLTDSVVSERALRELYLKGFEIAVKEGGCRSVMTTYGSLNGLWTAGCYDLCTTILREQWGFDGIVMTDWWAMGSYPGQAGSRAVKAPMIAAQNDLYMVTPDATKNGDSDDVLKARKAGAVTRWDLVRNAKNILGFLLRSPAILHKTGRIPAEELAEMNKKGDNDFSPADLTYYRADDAGTVTVDGADLHPKAGESEVFGILTDKMGVYSITMELRSDLSDLAQLPVTVYANNVLKTVISIQGTGGKPVTVKDKLDVFIGQTQFIKLYYGANGLVIDRVLIRLEEEFKRPHDA